MLLSTSQTPVLNDVRDVTLSQNARNGVIALVSYENKVASVLSVIANLLTLGRLPLNFGS